MVRFGEEAATVADMQHFAVAWHEYNIYAWLKR